ncbi:MAG: Polysaccharide biosynthesis protein [Candidatus Nomurabacteria bacterium GW2011_GWA2_40_9]|uniref:Polysaccharide biosynthesis protein n=1 Tax=Candidatus Nomurabacteria bacterium GW2011_GWA2_40_9 TaxID=1618734 RepID=A0A0G0TQ66_9BACT|nr:MAG: Polysaccharide biosynthesis protein [Candidatus Nomurabacteria bacterium GW2011_GWA2_40_9]
MNTARRLTANFLSLIFSEFVSKIAQIIIFAYLARSLGKESFGIFSFGLAFGLLAAIIADFGLSSLLVREISRSKKDAPKYLSNALLVKIFLALIAAALSYLTLSLMGYPHNARLIAYIMLLFAILQSFTDIYSSIFRAFEHMHYDALIKVLRMLVLSAIMFFSVKNNFSLAMSSLAFPISEAAILLTASALAYTKFVKADFSFDFAFSKHLLKESSFFFLSIAFAGIFLYIDWIMLSKLGSLSEVGIYAAASNIAIALMSVPMMYGNAVYPVISRFYMSSKERLKFVYERSFKYMLVIGIAVSAGIYALSKGIIALFYGKEYIASSIVLAIIGWHLCFRFANIISGFTLSSMDRQRPRVLSQGVAALSKIALNFILIPLYGIVGAAIATLASEILFFAAYNHFISEYGIKINIIRPFVKPAIAGFIMVASLIFIGNISENIFISLISGALIYSIAVLLLKTIDEEDKKLMHSIFKNA